MSSTDQANTGEDDVQQVTKQCAKCSETKDASEFNKDKASASGLSSWCKVCHNKANYVRRRKTVEKAMWMRASVRASKSGLPFTITEEDIFIPADCPCLGIPLRVAAGVVDDYSPTLDRLDNNRGYEPDNIWVISNRANLIKSVSTVDELFKIAYAVRDELNKRGNNND